MFTKNIFVLGDLAVDHTVFISNEPPRRRGRGESVHEVTRRLTTAGGAATVARTIAALNSGRTFLWGILGHSPWGDFRSILNVSQQYDNSPHTVDFRGTSDESGSLMNTVTRVITEPDGGGARQLSFRFDDHSNLHVTEDRRASALHFLKRAHEKYRLHGIVLRDLDMGALSPDLVLEVAAFAQREAVSLFVSPRFERKVYRDVEGTAVLPDLLSWCHIVGMPEDSDRWRARITSTDGLRDFVSLCVRHFRNFRHHFVKCGPSGLVVLVSDRDRARYSIYRLVPSVEGTFIGDSQIGSGDVLTGSVALSLAGDSAASAVLPAAARGQIISTQYWRMPWHRISGADLAKDIRATRTLTKTKPILELPTGLLSLPEKPDIHLSEHRTVIPNLFSRDKAFHARLKAFVDDVLRGFADIPPKSLILSAPGGSGKTTVIRELIEGEVLRGSGITAINFADAFEALPKTSEARIKLTLKEVSEKHASGGPLLLIVDELLKVKAKYRTLNMAGAPLLDAAHSNKIRFLFVDADFGNNELKLPINDQVSSRCHFHALIGLTERPVDVPVIAAARVFEKASEAGDSSLERIEMDAELLLAVTNATLEARLNPRTLCDEMDAAYLAARQNRDTKTVVLQVAHLREKLRKLGAEGRKLEGFTFLR